VKTRASFVSCLWRQSRLAAATAVFLAPGVARATWSIVAVDPDTGEAGVAVASCYSDVRIVAGLAPGHGAVAAQAYADLQYRGRDEAVRLLGLGQSPQDILDVIANASFDSQYQIRQYGIAALGFVDESASFTGTGADDWKGDVQGRAVAVQGNLLEGEVVVTDALAAFENAWTECPTALPDRLMDALEAGSLVGGDARCPPLTAWSAHLVVVGPDDDPDAPSLEFFVPDQSGPGGENPVMLLRAEFDAWREANPLDDSGCGEGTGTRTDIGTGGGTGTGTGGDDGSGDASGSAAGTGTDGGRDGGSGDSEGTKEGRGDGDDAGEGCGCSSVPSPATALGLWLLIAVRRRSG
jgi:uncharacterized Ntn-hydrolase superfamily protein